MTLLASQSVRRFAVLLSLGIAGVTISTASTLPGPVEKPEGEIVYITPASLLPPFTGTAGAFADTDSTSPSNAAGDGVLSAAGAPAPTAALNGRVASGDLVAIAVIDDLNARADRGSCMPEPVSVILMTTGLLGLLGFRRYARN